jgi:hypothetical protein
MGETVHTPIHQPESYMVPQNLLYFTCEFQPMHEKSKVNYETGGKVLERWVG